MIIEAILFDLGKVILDFDMEPAVQTLLANSGLERESLDHVLWDTGRVRSYERGEISTLDFYEYLRREARLDMSYESFRWTWSAVFASQTILPESLFARLKVKYPLVLVSNTNEAHVAYIAAHYRIFDYFDRCIFSHEVQCLKPEARIFEEAIRASGRPPEALFYVDDREENVEAATNLGMRAHRFRSESDLLRAFAEVGIEV